MIQLFVSVVIAQRSMDIVWLVQVQHSALLSQNMEEIKTWSFSVGGILNKRTILYLNLCREVFPNYYSFCSFSNYLNVLPSMLIFDLS